MSTFNHYKTEFGCLPFTRKIRLVDSCSKWDALNTEWQFLLGCARSIFKTYPRKIGSKAIKPDGRNPRGVVRGFPQSVHDASTFIPSDEGYVLFLLYALPQVVDVYWPTGVPRM